MAEHLAAFSTILSFLKQRGSEQIGDIPVPHGRGGSGGGGLHGFLPEQNSTALMAEQLVDNPVRSGGLLCFLPEQDSTALVAEQLVDKGHVDDHPKTAPLESPVFCAVCTASPVSVKQLK